MNRFSLVLECRTVWFFFSLFKHIEYIYIDQCSPGVNQLNFILSNSIAISFEFFTMKIVVFFSQIAFECDYIRQKYCSFETMIKKYSG